MTNYRYNKLGFDKEKNLFKVNRQSNNLLREFVTPTRATKFNIELLEITEIENPTNITLEVTFNYTKKRTLKLYLYRTQFVYQNNIFILDTKSIDEFQLDFPKNDEYFEFSIQVNSENNFNMTLYYSTDQEESRFGYEFI